MNTDVQTSLNEIVFSASTKITFRLHVTMCIYLTNIYPYSQIEIDTYPICLILEFSSIIESN